MLVSGPAEVITCCAARALDVNKAMARMAMTPTAKAAVAVPRVSRYLMVVFQ
jgi:hypothetical protein